VVTFRLNDGEGEMNRTPDDFSVTQTLANNVSAPRLLFIHGFLDDATVWDGVIASLAGKVSTVRYVLPGFGTRAPTVDHPRAITLESLAAEA
jgi:pimeloyl-ACP methyl ester carboxylesterase